MEKAVEAFRTISEVAEELDVPKHVLRFWEGKFPQIKPMKRGGGRRYYRPDDVVLLKGIRRLLYDEGYTIKGVQKVIRDSGLEFVKTSVGGVPGSTETPVQTGDVDAPSAPPEVAEPARATPRAARARPSAEVAPAAATIAKPGKAAARRAPAERAEPAAPPRASVEEAAPSLSPEQTRRLRQARRELEICLHLLTNDDDDDASGSAEE